MDVISVFMSGLLSRAGLTAVALLGGIWLGYSAASKGEAVRTLKNESAALRASLAAHQAAAKTAADEAEKLSQRQREMQEMLDAYRQELAQRSNGDACRLYDADIERLRKLR